MRELGSELLNLFPQAGRLLRLERDKLSKGQDICKDTERHRVGGTWI